MTALSVQPPFPILTDIDGQPLEDGYIWIGVVNLAPITNPITVYWDAALTIPAPLPIRTRGGYPINSGTPARLYVNSDYSIQVQNRNGSVVYTSLYNNGPLFGGTISSANVTFLQAGSGAVERTAQSKMRDTVSVNDFGAVGDGVADDTVAIQTAFNSGAKDITFPPGTYKITATEVSPLVLSTSNVSVSGHGATILNATSSGFATWKVTGSDVTIEGLTIDGNNTSLNCFLIGDTAKRVTVAKCTVRNFQQQSGDAAFAVGIAIQNGADTITVSDCYIHDIQAPITGIARGVLTTGYATAATHATNVTIENSLFEDIGPVADGDAIVFQPDASTFHCLSRVVNCTFRNCAKRAVKIQASGCQVIGGYCDVSPTVEMYAGVSIYGDDCSVVGFTLQGGNTQHGVEIGATGTTIGNNSIVDSCTIKMTTAPGSNDAIRVYGTVNNIAITNNVINTARYGVNINADGEGFVIGNNVLRGIGITGVLVQGTGSPTVYPDGVSVTGNAFSNITSFTINNLGATRFVATGNSSDGTSFGINDPTSSRSTYVANAMASAPVETFGTAPPSAGDWIRGDLVWNASPSQFAPVGWACVTSGTPGTWLPFGNPANERVSATAIADVTNAINTTGKFQGKIIYDTTNNRLMIAASGVVAGVWWVVDGSASVTPS
jgi:hypothetical protein